MHTSSMGPYSLLLLAYSWLVLGTTWNWIQDGFNTVRERSELILQESMGSLRELTSTAPRIYSAFGTLEETDKTADKTEAVKFSDDAIEETFEDAGDEINYEIGLGDSSSVCSNMRPFLFILMYLAYKQ